MKTGKISENILKRSVLRQIKNHREEVVKGAGIGEDCAFLSWKSSGAGQGAFVSSQTIALPVEKASYLAVMAAANNLWAAGAVPTAVTLSITLPKESEEALLKETIRQAENCCQKLNMQIAGGHTEVSKAVNWPVITATAIGMGEASQTEKVKGTLVEGLDIVMSKWIGMEGTSMIANKKESELSKRYPHRLISMAREQENYLSIAPEAAIALKSGVYAMHDVRNGGIFGALWEVSRKLGVGLYIDLKKIPVRQETIEICEFYHLNPYQLLSGGALIMLTQHGQGLVENLENEGIFACVIGSTNNGNDKIIANQEETRYLEPPAPDEIYKLSFI